MFLATLGEVLVLSEVVVGSGDVALDLVDVLEDEVLGERSGRRVGALRPEARTSVSVKEIFQI